LFNQSELNKYDVKGCSISGIAPSRSVNCNLDLKLTLKLEFTKEISIDVTQCPGVTGIAFERLSGDVVLLKNTLVDETTGVECQVQVVHSRTNEAKAFKINSGNNNINL
jgi:hypothetical protein